MSHILIIEDDDAIAAIERDYLELNNMTVQVEATGPDGLQCALNATPPFDLILLDVMLPGLDGFTLCRQLRESLNIPILMVTARREDIDKIRGLGMGADDYIVKPFSPNELVARVKAHLERYQRLTGSPAHTPAELCIGAVRLNPQSRRVYVREQEVELKNKEYELLWFLMRNADMVFSREYLYEQVWGMDAVGDTATVSVHINRLREKIEADPAKPFYLQTVWGAGYRFRA